jgi:hypothetical protein
VSSTTGIAVAAAEDDNTATTQRLAGSGAVMTGRRRRDVVEAVRRSGDNAAQTKCTLRDDARASVWRSGRDAEKQTENGLVCADTDAVNRAGDEIKGQRGRVWNEVERENKSSGRSHGSRDGRERGTIWRERDRADEIKQQKRAGGTERMKSRQQICDE